MRTYSRTPAGREEEAHCCRKRTIIYTQVRPTSLPVRGFHYFRRPLYINPGSSQAAVFCQTLSTRNRLLPDCYTVRHKPLSPLNRSWPRNSCSAAVSWFFEPDMYMAFLVLLVPPVWTFLSVSLSTNISTYYPKMFTCFLSDVLISASAFWSFESDN